MTRTSFPSQTVPDMGDTELRLIDFGDLVEADVRAGRTPPLSDYLARMPESVQTRAFHELLVIEMQARRAAGQEFSAADYRTRYPDRASEVEAAESSAFRPPTERGPSPRRTALAGDIIGKYRLIREIGRGGMGIVFLALDSGTGTWVAIKFIPPEFLSGSAELAAKSREMFDREADAARKIDHPNVVKVIDRGEDAGHVYLVMEYVEGPTLREHLRSGGPQHPALAAEMVAAIAGGVAAAHAENIIHRDIKPANVLLAEADGAAESASATTAAIAHVPGRFSDMQAVRIPKLADFGLAKQMDPNRSQVTLSVGGMGTLAYAAPEQAGGDTETGRYADVYSLGAVLYECLTGRPPFQAADTKETLRQVLFEDPAPPRRLNPQVPVAIDRICLQCLRKNPHRRYPSADELAADLRRFLAGAPIWARYDSLAVRVRKWAGRHPVRATAVAAVVVAAVGLAILWQAEERVQQAKRVSDLIATLVVTEPARVPGVLDDLDAAGSRAEAALRGRWDEAADGSLERQRLALALARFTPDRGDTPEAQALEARIAIADPAELRLIRDALAPRASSLRPILAAGLRDADPDRRLQYAAVLAGFDPEAVELRDQWQGVAERLVKQDPVELAAWVEVFRPAATALRPPLTALFEARLRPPESQAAAAILVAYLDATGDLLDLIGRDADEAQFRIVAAKLLTRPESCREELAKRLTGTFAGADEAAKDIAARVQANYAILALRLDPAGPAWNYLTSPPATDHRLQTYLIHWLAPRGVLAEEVIGRWKSANPLAPLILAAGTYDEQQLPPARRATLATELLSLFQTHPDCGVHSAAEWLLRKWGYGGDIENAVANLPRGPSDGREWYVTKSGLTMAVFAKPVQFRLSYREYGPAALNGAAVRTEAVIQPFAISVRHLPREMVETWFIHALRKKLERAGGLCHQAIAPYCNGLTVAEGLGENQCCYEQREGWWYLKPIDYHLKGYRLPTEAEVQYAVRLGTESPRFYGHDPKIFDDYAHDPRRVSHPAPGTMYLPNGRGLFDGLTFGGECCTHRPGPRDARKQESYHGGAFATVLDPARNDSVTLWDGASEMSGSCFRIAQSLLPADPR